MPPFAKIYNNKNTKILSYCDKSLIEQGDTIYFNAGHRTHSLEINIKDYLKCEDHISL